MSRAVVVGSGPNGLAGAITLAQRDVEVLVLEASDRVGGGTLTSELTVPALPHDQCAAFNPTCVASPFFQALALQEPDLTWICPEVPLAHPHHGGRTAPRRRALARTAHGHGGGGRAW